MPYGPQGYFRLIPSLVWQSSEQVSRVLQRVGPGATIVDLGAGGRKISPKTVCLDFAPAHNTDVVGDVQRLPFRSGSVDLVYATGLFEHVEDERVVIREIARVLKPGGIAHVEVPFLEQYHEDPIDVRRMTVPGLERALAAHGLVSIARGAHIGPTVTLINTWARWWALVFDGRSLPAKLASNGVFLACSVVGWPFKFLDALVIKKRQAHTLALGVYCTARKSD